MISHRLQTRISKTGYLELTDLPFKEGTEIEITISKRKKRKNLNMLISNDHVWSEADIQSIESGRNILNQWKIS